MYMYLSRDLFYEGQAFEEEDTGFEEKDTCLGIYSTKSRLLRKRIQVFEEEDTCLGIYSTRGRVWGSILRGAGYTCICSYRHVQRRGGSEEYRT